MKPLRTLAAFLSLVAFTCHVSAQTALTTYYVIPPSNGCDGIWAFGPYSTMWANCGTAPYQWLFDPIACVDPQGVNIPLNVVNDTIVMPLCSQPCNFELYSVDSGLCQILICGIGPTALADVTGEARLIIGPNPVPSSAPLLLLNTVNNGPQHLQVLDFAGRSLLVRTLNGGRSELDVSGIPPGGYLLLIRNDDGHMSTQRFQIE
ncbi:MAG: T9SS type A sorting domain-containing protein [Flavobacteriales bacterium]|nr:T9SS type A sorting domain-containing protein [Flavobacteriales bacterium]